MHVQLKCRKKLDQLICLWAVLRVSITDWNSSDKSFCIKAESLTQLYFSVTFLARQICFCMQKLVLYLIISEDTIHQYNLKKFFMYLRSNLFRWLLELLGNEDNYRQCFNVFFPLLYFFLFSETEHNILLMMHIDSI